MGVTEDEAIEMIDIGGPSLLRGAAKNFAHCAPVCRPAQYHQVLEELRASGELSLETRRRLAAEAFAHTAAYEAAITTWFNGREEFPDSLVISLEKVQDLAYGENPHQRAAYYAERGVARAPPLARRAAARQGALLQQPQRLLGAPARSRASSRCRRA